MGRQAPQKTPGRGHLLRGDGALRGTVGAGGGSAWGQRTVCKQFAVYSGLATPRIIRTKQDMAGNLENMERNDVTSVNQAIKPHVTPPQRDATVTALVLNPLEDSWAQPRTAGGDAGSLQSRGV